MIDKFKKAPKIFSHLSSSGVKFFVAHQLQISFLIILLMVLAFLSQLPYLSVLGANFLFFLFWLVFIFLFRAPVRISIGMALAILFLGVFLMILGEEKLAGKLGNVAYGLLWIGVIQEFVVLLREKRKR